MIFYSLFLMWFQKSTVCLVLSVNRTKEHKDTQINRGRQEHMKKKNRSLLLDMRIFGE